MCLIQIMKKSNTLYDSIQTRERKNYNFQLKMPFYSRTYGSLSRKSQTYVNLEKAI